MVRECDGRPAATHHRPGRADLRRREAGQRGVDQLAEEPLAERRVALHETVVERPIEKIERELDVSRRG
jgi:hypothetical protein